MFQYPVGVVRSQTNLTALYGLSSFWDTFFQNSNLFNDVLGVQTNLYGQLYSELIQNMSPISLSTTSAFRSREIQLEVMPPDGPYTLSSNVASCTYIVDRPVLPRVVLENGVDFTISNGEIVWANPERVSSYPFALQTNQTGALMGLWLVDTLTDESWLYNYYGSLLNVPYQPSSTAFSQFLQGVLYLQVQGPIVDVLTAGLQITLGLPLALYDEVVLSTSIVQGEYVIVTDQTSYSISAELGLRIPLGTQLTVGEPLFPQVGAVVDWQIQDKWWINLRIPEQILPNPPMDPLCLQGNWADQLMETYLKTHSFMVELGVPVTQAQEFANLLQNTVPTYTYPWVFTVVSDTETLTITDTMEHSLAAGDCQRLPQIDLFTKQNYNYQRGCPLFNRYSVPKGVYDRNLSPSSLAQSNADYITYFARSAFVSDPITVSYANGTISNRNMATPRLRSSYTPLRGIDMDSVNPWPTLIPYFMASESYIKQFAQPSLFFTLVPFDQIPAPSNYQYLNWYYDEKTRLPDTSFTSVPSGSQLALFNLIDDVYGVCLVLPEGEIGSFVQNLKFGDIRQPLDEMTVTATIPLFRGAASNFANPFFLGKTGSLQNYSDSLNASMPIDRSGGFYLETRN